MSSSNYSQLESRNDERLESLANKLATFKNINQEIGDQAINDNSLMNQLSNSFDSMLNNVRNTSGRLTRSMRAGNNIWRMVGISLVLFFIVYNLYKFF
ncbi:hypothetical protein Kpol_1056p39 [Vanderwaltozyma polyspora DSM 70294]|uniref:t-SNARE coiled-coil homology domain-containing protein n=1 Tax=Vanderwaltozyma polyspora (strain ATCC 22028 / DSM 70294 / BCRC 21397 / CBS 2163 / NBRC 10782 / NRRL Y-8283 / UCD 57-17) TaxID=436907 RepID=A7TLP6_VANPO|nr:uncharacterized protein Kpol_1056p39 [Vanderwaltozyma polyspora DSM 70294]EDO16838.1 hypothetical protein Kpol_1056p39 [Vanderwaltozyma polyspora DSM 70294]